MSRYFMLVDGQRVGPLDPPEMLARGMNTETQVWAQGWTDWRRAAEVDELRALPDGLPPPARPETAPAPALPPFSRSSALPEPQAPAPESPVRGSVDRTVEATPQPFPIAAHIVNLVCAGLLILILTKFGDRHGLFGPWLALVPSPIFGLIGAACGGRSIDFWWGYWLGIIGWLISVSKRSGRKRARLSAPVTRTRN